MTGNNQNFVNPGVPTPVEGTVPGVAALVPPEQAVAQGAPQAGPEKAAEPPQPQTPREKLEARIAKAEEKLKRDAESIARLRAQLGSIDAIAAIQPGVNVRAVLGRADTKREVLAVVTGTREVKGKLKIALYYGEGFDAQTAVVDTDSILEVLK